MPSTTFIRRQAGFNFNGRFTYNQGILSKFFGITAKNHTPNHKAHQARNLVGRNQLARTIGDSRSWVIPLPSVPASPNTCTTHRALRINSFSAYIGDIWEIAYRSNRTACLQHAYSSIPYIRTMNCPNVKFAARVSAFWDYTINADLQRFDTHISGRLDTEVWKVWNTSFKFRKQRFKRTGLNRDPGAGENNLEHCAGMASKKLPVD